MTSASVRRTSVPCETVRAPSRAHTVYDPADLPAVRAALPEPAAVPARPTTALFRAWYLARAQLVGPPRAASSPPTRSLPRSLERRHDRSIFARVARRHDAVCRCRTFGFGAELQPRRRHGP